MKKNFYLAVLLLVLIGCSNSGERVLTSATGSIYECLIVSDEGVKEALCETMGADMYGLPQMEPIFTVSHVTSGQFDHLVKGARNIVMVDIDERKYTRVMVKYGRDVWSTPQAVVRIQAPDKESFLSYWEANGEKIREWVVSEEKARQIRFLRANTNKEARERLQAAGYDMLIPEDYTTVKAEDGIVWCCNNKGPMRKDIVIYSYPYGSQDQFSRDSIIARRNAIMGKEVSGAVSGSYMTTEEKHFPPVSRYTQAPRDTTGGFYGIETRGLWKLAGGEAMGGPFVSLTRLDPVNGRVVTAEGFLYAAGQKKRNAMRQIEAILYTLQMPQER